MTMIFTLMKNRRIRLHVFVLWLVLGVGLLPEKTSALKCYSCDGPDCKTNFKATAKEADCATGYCEKIMDGDTLKMQCSSEVKEGECIKKEFPDGCYTFSEENKEKLTKCTGAADSGATAGKEGIKICSCDSELCNNNGESGAAGAGGGGSNQTTGGTAGRKFLPEGKNLTCHICRNTGECADRMKWTKRECHRPDNVCVVSTRDGVTVERSCGAYTEKDMACLADFGSCAKFGDEGFRKCLAGPDHTQTDKGIRDHDVNCLCTTDLCNLGERPGYSYKLILFLGILAASYGSLTRL